MALPVGEELEVTTVTRGVGVRDSFGVAARFEGDGVRGLDRWVFRHLLGEGEKSEELVLHGGCY